MRAMEAIGKSELKKKLNSIRDKKSLLLDSGSTFSVCNNPKMLINIRECDKPISGVSNGGGINNEERRGPAGVFHGVLQPPIANEHFAIK